MNASTTMALAPSISLSPDTLRWSDSDNPSVSAIFLWQGIKKCFRSNLSAQHGGEIGIADWVMQFASICEDLHHRLPDDLPGVFHYDVVEGMGDWLGEQVDVTHDAFRQELESRTVVWLKDTPAKSFLQSIG